MSKEIVSKMAEAMRLVDSFHEDEMRRFAPDAPGVVYRKMVWDAEQVLLAEQIVFVPSRDPGWRVREVDPVRIANRARNFFGTSQRKARRSLTIVDTIDESKLPAAQARGVANVRNRIARSMIQMREPGKDPAEIKAPPRPSRRG